MTGADAIASAAAAEEADDDDIRSTDVETKDLAAAVVLVVVEVRPALPVAA